MWILSRGGPCDDEDEKGKREILEMCPEARTHYWASAFLVPGSRREGCRSVDWYLFSCLIPKVTLSLGDPRSHGNLKRHVKWLQDEEQMSLDRGKASFHSHSHPCVLAFLDFIVRLAQGSGEIS